jgi:hypothetical protein
MVQRPHAAAEDLPEAPQQATAEAGDQGEGWAQPWREEEV